MSNEPAQKSDDRSASILQRLVSELPRNNFWTKDYGTSNSGGIWHWGGDTFQQPHTACGKTIPGSPYVERHAVDLQAMEDAYGDQLCPKCIDLRRESESR